METILSQNKLKNKLPNRVFAITFSAFIIIWVYYFITTWDIGRESRIELIIPELIYLMIVAGLLIEIWKPSLDFTFRKDRKLVPLSIILFAVFILINVNFWLAYGIVDWLPQYGWSKTIIEYLTRTFVMETSSLSLMFGILFLTKSVPRKSLSYKIILIGAVLFELFLFLGYIQWATSGEPGSQYYSDFWGHTIFQPWFWLDLTSEIAILVGALWLLTRGRVYPESQ